MSQAERAGLRQENNQELGGIDSNPSNFDLSIENEGEDIEFYFDERILKELPFDGFIPVSINIQPVVDLKLFLGKEDEPQPQAPTELLSLR